MTPASRGSTVFIGVILAFSFLLLGLVVWHGLAFANEATCGPDAPVAWRHSIVLIGACAYAIVAIPALVLSRRAGDLALVVSLLLAVCALCVPVLVFAFEIFSAGMC